MEFLIRNRLGDRLLTSKYEWQIEAELDKNVIAKLAAETKLDTTLVQILYRRGYQTATAIENFIHPSDSELNDAFLLYDIDKAVERIQTAAFAGEKIVVYGDYDVDGITATAVMYSTLEQLGADVSYYVPDRFKDGYGPNKAAYQRLIEAGAQLIVTVDNGVAGHEAIDYANSQGVDVVVTDHHELPPTLPAAYALVHPRHPKGNYPFGGLAGVGVAFKVATALLDEVPSDMLDLVALGTVADLVPLVKENRLLVRYGLEVLKTNPRLGLKSLYELAQLNPEELTEQTIAFQLAPRLNSLGRIAQAKLGVELLTTEELTAANQLAASCQAYNQQRQELVEQITAQALAKVAANDTNAVNLVYERGWHEGVLGIVASRLVEETGKPSLVLSVNEAGLAKGSGRSVAGFDLFAALDHQRDLLDKFGGHEMACGLTIAEASLPKLQVQLNAEAKTQGLTAQTKQPLHIDAELKLEQITPTFYQQLQSLAPFGTENEEPLFLITGYDSLAAKAIGKENNHLRLELSGSGAGPSISGVAFSLGNQAVTTIVAHSEALRFVGTLSENKWRNQVSLQIMIKDLELDQDKSQGVIIDQRTNKLRKSLFTKVASYIFFDAKLKEKVTPLLPSGANALLAAEIDDAYQAQELYLVDCPQSLTQLEALLPRLEFAKLYLLFYQQDNAYLLGLPTREQFARVYRFSASHKNVAIYQRLDELANYLKIRRELLIFILQVFFELGFVKIENGLMNYVPDVKAQALENAECYQARKLRMQAESTLLFSNSTSLTQYLTKFLKR